MTPEEIPAMNSAGPIGEGSRCTTGWYLALVLLFASAVGLENARAQQPASEIDKLHKQLEQAQREIQTLREENARLKAALAERNPPSPGTATAPSINSTVEPRSLAPSWAPKTTVPGSSPDPVPLPGPIDRGTLVTVDQLLTDYRASVRAADARYKGQEILIKGVPFRIARTFVDGVWNVRLKGMDTIGTVRCQVSFPDFSEYRSSTQGDVIAGRRRAGEWETLLKTGRTVVLEGTCTGADGDTVVVRDCHLAPSS